MINLIILMAMSSVKAEILTFEKISKKLSHKSSVNKKMYKEEGVIDKALGYRKMRNELRKANKKLDSYRYISKLQMTGPVIMKDNIINEAQMIGAKNSVSIYATATPSKVILSNLVGTDIPKDSKIICEVFTKYKRICGSCNRLIIGQEGYDISASIYNKDGSNCAVGKISDDSEAYLVGVGISELAQGALAVAQSTTPTILGNIVDITAKNQLNQGLQNIGNEATDLFKEEYNTREPIVRLKRGSNVAIFFNKGLSI